MSTNELRPGRRPIRVEWPDDSGMSADQEGVVSMEMVAVEGSVNWVKVVFTDGEVALLNPEHLALIIFKD